MAARPVIVAPELGDGARLPHGRLRPGTGVEDHSEVVVGVAGNLFVLTGFSAELVERLARHAPEVRKIGERARHVCFVCNVLATEPFNFG